MANQHLGSLSKAVTFSLTRFYRWFLSPVLHTLGGPSSGCRFHLTCSRYFEKVIERFGWRIGLMLTLKRFSQCHPWG